MKKTKANNEVFPKAWYISFLCAIELCCCRTRVDPTQPPATGSFHYDQNMQLKIVTNKSNVYFSFLHWTKEKSIHVNVDHSHSFVEELPLPLKDIRTTIRGPYFRWRQLKIKMSKCQTPFSFPSLVDSCLKHTQWVWDARPNQKLWILPLAWTSCRQVMILSRCLQPLYGWDSMPIQGESAHQLITWDKRPKQEDGITLLCNHS